MEAIRLKKGNWKQTNPFFYGTSPMAKELIASPTHFVGTAFHIVNQPLAKRGNSQKKP